MQLIPNPVSIPVDAAFGHHTVDLVFVPPQRSIDITMILLPGIEQLAFTGMTFGAGAADRAARRPRLSRRPPTKEAITT